MYVVTELQIHLEEDYITSRSHGFEAIAGLTALVDLLLVAGRRSMPSHDLASNQPGHATLLCQLKTLTTLLRSVQLHRI